MKEIKVSIIVPVYNVEAYLDKCLNSLVNQTLKEIEIIVVNDGSPDNSKEIIKKYAKKYPKIIVSLEKENGGLSSARNYGLKHANGEYIGFVDGDDFVELDMYEKMYQKAKENKYDILVCSTELVFENTNKTIPASFNLTNDYKDYLLSVPMACNKIFKRELFQDPFLFKEGIWYEDLELIPTLIIKTKNIGFLNEAFYKYIQRNGSIMNQEKFNPKTLDIYKVLESIEEKFKNFSEYENYEKEIEYLYIEHLLYSSSLRLSPYIEGKKYLKEFKNLINKKFPNWKQNIYLKKKSIPFQLVVFLSSHEARKLLYFLNKRRNS